MPRTQDACSSACQLTNPTIHDIRPQDILNSLSDPLRISERNQMHALRQRQHVADGKDARCQIPSFHTDQYSVEGSGTDARLLRSSVEHSQSYGRGDT
jgi:hypothetical protein